MPIALKCEIQKGENMLCREQPREPKVALWLLAKQHQQNHVM